MALFFSFLIAMFVTMLLIPPLMRSAQRMQVVDFPGERKVHCEPIPRIGGVAMVAGAVLPIAMWLVPQREVVALLIGMSVILVFGVWDDRRDLDYRIKFLGQLIAALVVVVYGEVRIETLPFGASQTLSPSLSIPLTVFALLGITNAINLADGLDGLAGGTTLLSLGAIALLGYLQNDLSVVMIALAVIGSILGFLRFNTHPARIFMGDGGSQFLGFSVGALVIMLTYDTHSALSSALPLLLLGLPILDTLMVMTQRLLERRSPFSPDKNHIHHKLLERGLDHYEAVFLIYAVQASLVLAAYLLRYQADELIVAIYVAFCAGVWGCLTCATHYGWRLRPAPERSYVSRKLRWLRNDGGLVQAAFGIAATGVMLYLLAGATLSEAVSLDIGILALALLLTLTTIYKTQRAKPFNWVERAATYVLITCIVYLTQTKPGAFIALQSYSLLYFGVLAAAVMVGFRFSKEKTFKMTPLDFLVIFIALTVPNLPELYFAQLGLGESIAKIIVLFYGAELVLINIARRHDSLRWVLYLCLAILSVRGLLV